PKRLPRAALRRVIKNILLEVEGIENLYPGGVEVVDVLVDPFLRAITMLRHSSLTPADVERLAGRSADNLSRRLMVLSSVYSRYLEALASLDAVDEVGYLVGAGRRAPEVMDSIGKEFHLLGFYDLSRAQAHLVKGLLDGGGRVWIRLREGWSPYSEPLRSQFKRLEEVLGRRIPLPLPATSSPSSVLEIHSHPTTLSEVNWALRTVRRLLREGVSPSNIAIAVRELDNYLPQILLRAPRYGVPLTVASHEGLKLSQVPSVKLILDIVKAAALDGPREYMIPIIASPLIRRWLSFSGIEELDMVLRERGYEEGVAFLEEILKEVEDSEGLLRLTDLLRTLRKKRELKKHLEAVMGITEEFFKALEGLDEGGVWGGVNREALSRLYAEMWSLSHLSLGYASASELLDILEDVSESVRVSPFPGGPEGVVVASFRELLPLGRKYVIVLGVDQEYVPQPFRGIPLLSPEEGSWFNRSIGREVFITGDSHIEGERFLLNGVLNSAEGVYLSYRYMDSKGRVNIPSPFIAPLLLRVGEERWSVKESLVPPMEVVEGMDEVLLLLSKGVINQYKEIPDSLKKRFEAILERSRGERERIEGKDLGPFDGVVEDEEILSDLKKWGSDEKPFSSVSLEEYGTCPMRFFFRYVLKIEPLPEVEAEPTPLTFGTIIHSVLEEIFSDYDRLKSMKKEELESLLERLVDERVARFRHTTSHHLKKRLLDGEKGLLAFLTSHLTGLLESGRVPVGTEMEFEALSERALKLPGGGVVSVVGRVDRVDMLGEEIFVVDYKSGSSYGYRFLDSNHLQLPLYLNVLKEIMGKRVGGGEYLFTNYPFRVKGSKQGSLHRDLSLSLKYVETYVNLIRSGIFPPIPEDPLSWAEKEVILLTTSQERCRYCPYKDACRISSSVGRLVRNPAIGGGSGG
ncbi:MAG: PD-(D/E)XK nuclease family protein, partial [Thermoplasmata archaeon]|nr:PD-(D/E)XK nuclease family protein [Thermoplasmata archaeon]